MILYLSIDVILSVFVTIFWCLFVHRSIFSLKTYYIYLPSIIVTIKSAQTNWAPPIWWDRKQETGPKVSVNCHSWTQCYSSLVSMPRGLKISRNSVIPLLIAVTQIERLQPHPILAADLLHLPLVASAHARNMREKCLQLLYAFMPWKKELSQEYTSTWRAEYFSCNFVSLHQRFRNYFKVVCLLQNRTVKCHYITHMFWHNKKNINHFCAIAYTCILIYMLGHTFAHACGTVGSI